MADLAQQLKELDSFKLNKVIIEQVIAQIEKDFSAYELGLVLDEAISPGEALLNKLVPFIEYMFEKQLEQLFALLYRIDLPEEKVKAALLQEQAALNLSEMIINRELQKVIIRNFYKA